MARGPMQLHRLKAGLHSANKKFNSLFLPDTFFWTGISFDGGDLMEGITFDGGDCDEST